MKKKKKKMNLKNEDEKTILVGLSVGYAFNPREIIKEVPRDLAHRIQQRFSRMLLTDSSLSHLLQLIDPERDNVLKTDVIDSWSTGVHLDYRGYRFAILLRYCLYREAYIQGYRVITAQCLSPITHVTAVQAGWIPLLSCSISYVDYELNGVKPVECIQFKSNIPGADNSALCVYNNVLELVKTSSKSLREGRLPKIL